MIDSLYIGATGMHAQQMGVDTVATNLANMNTPAYKKSYVVFEDMVSKGITASLPAGVLGADPASATGLGVGVGRNAKSFQAGELKQTNLPMDLAIRGQGMLEVMLPDGGTAYVRGGGLKVNQDGMLSTQSGYPLKAMISLPDDAQEMQIDADGRVSVWTSGSTSATELGRLDMVRFTSPEDLVALGEGMYQASEQSGEAIAGRPGEDGMGVYAQGFSEASNVQLNDEIVNLMLAQRAYEANAKIVQASDEMLGMINNLRR